MALLFYTSKELDPCSSPQGPGTLKPKPLFDETNPYEEVDTKADQPVRAGR